MRERVVAMLANVDRELAETLADRARHGDPRAAAAGAQEAPKPEVDVSPALSLSARPGDGSIRTRRIAIFVADGVDGDGARALHARPREQGAVPRYVGARLGSVTTERGDTLEVEVTFETMPSVLFDAAAVPDGKLAGKILGNVGHALEFLKDQYRHAKPILALGAGADLVENAGLPGNSLGRTGPRNARGQDGAAKALPDFVKAIARHRHHEREMDPPEV